MVNDLIDGISIRLNAVFGAAYRIYSEKVEQGLVEPAFFIKSLNATQTKLIGNRYLREYSFDVHYFPEDSTSNKEMLTVAEQLLEEMEFITLVNGDQVMGVSMNYEIIDSVLHFFINYNLTVTMAADPVDDMEEVLVNAGLEG